MNLHFLRIIGQDLETESEGMDLMTFTVQENPIVSMTLFTRIGSNYKHEKPLEYCFTIGKNTV